MIDKHILITKIYHPDYSELTTTDIADAIEHNTYEFLF